MPNTSSPTTKAVIQYRIFAQSFDCDESFAPASTLDTIVRPSLLPDVVICWCAQIDAYSCGRGGTDDCGTNLNIIIKSCGWIKCFFFRCVCCQYVCEMFFYKNENVCKCSSAPPSLQQKNIDSIHIYWDLRNAIKSLSRSFRWRYISTAEAIAFNRSIETNEDVLPSQLVFRWMANDQNSSNEEIEFWPHFIDQRWKILSEERTRVDCSIFTFWCFSLGIFSIGFLIKK